jgi:SET domain-containing protein
MASRRIAAHRSVIHGTGVRALTSVRKGEQIIEYKGLLRTTAQASRLQHADHESGHTFLFTLNEDYVIDANVGGNTARWLNHSCSPNCVAYVHDHPSGDPRKARVIIEALKKIGPGEELTYNYGIVLEERHTPRLKRIWACKCGARNCTGTMLQPKR